MQFRNTFLALSVGLSVVMTTAKATVIDLNYNSWGNAVVSNNQTVSWTFDFSGYEITPDTVIDSAMLSITAQAVDANADPVRIENNLLLGNLRPGSGTTQFDLPGMSGTYDYLLDGMLTVSMTANEIYQAYESHPVTARVPYTEVHPTWEWHTYWGVPYPELHYPQHRHYKDVVAYTIKDLHTYAGTLKLTSSNLSIKIQDPHKTKTPQVVQVSEPATLALMSIGLLGVMGLRTRASRK